jgi:hypothetical protein
MIHSAYVSEISALAEVLDAPWTAAIFFGILVSILDWAPGALIVLSVSGLIASCTGERIWH